MQNHMVKCTNCNGFGHLFDLSHGALTDNVDCDHCNATGMVPVGTPAPTLHTASANDVFAPA